MMLATAMPSGMTSSAMRVPPAEISPAAVEAVRRVPAASAASHMEAA